MSPTQFDIAARAVKFVCDRYHMPVSAIEGRGRIASIAWPRMCAIRLAVRYAGLSLGEAGLIFHREHTTIFYALKSHEDWLNTDQRRGKEFAKIEAEFTNHLELCLKDQPDFLPQTERSSANGSMSLQNA